MKHRTDEYHREPAIDSGDHPALLKNAELGPETMPQDVRMEWRRTPLPARGDVSFSPHKSSLSSLPDAPCYVLATEQGLWNFVDKTFQTEASAHAAAAKLMCCWVLYARTKSSAFLYELSCGGIGLAHASIREHVTQKYHGHIRVSPEVDSEDLLDNVLSQFQKVPDREASYDRVY